MSDAWTIAALYHFADLPDCEVFADALLKLGESVGLVGTFVIAKEGLNGTVAGSPEAVDTVLAHIRSDERFADIEAKFSTCDFPPFGKFKIKVKPEIVTLRQPGLDPRRDVGTYVEPEAWNALISDPEVLLIDTRNDYEFKVGRFKGAVDPQTDDFTAFTDYVRENLDAKRHKKVAMYCTGGIRCEKATALMLREGFEEVYHLHGGILKYLEEVPAEKSLWEGECFVFDGRVAVDHELKPAGWKVCPRCYWPYRGACDCGGPDSGRVMAKNAEPGR